jgi:hypothetical protein
MGRALAILVLIESQWRKLGDTEETGQVSFPFTVELSIHPSHFEGSNDQIELGNFSVYSSTYPR